MGTVMNGDRWEDFEERRLRDVKRRLDADPHLRLLAIYQRERGVLPDPPLPGCGCSTCTGLPARPRTTTPPPVSRKLDPLDVDAAKRTPILDVVRRLGLGEPRRVGREWKSRCPLHEDRHPSLRIDASRGVWFCDPCGTGGDTIKLVIRVRRCSFPDAVKWIAGRL